MEKNYKRKYEELRERHGRLKQKSRNQKVAYRNLQRAYEWTLRVSGPEAARLKVDMKRHETIFKRALDLAGYLGPEERQQNPASVLLNAFEQACTEAWKQGYAEQGACYSCEHTGSCSSVPVRTELGRQLDAAKQLDLAGFDLRRLMKERQN